MADTTIGPGAVVVLNSGGPKMTVSRIENNLDGSESAVCAWFNDERKRDVATFPVKPLKLSD